MDAIRFGDPNIILKGIVEQIYYDPTTGNIIGYDNVGTEGAIETEVNLQEITGGFGNPVIGIIPDSTRMTGTYTSAAFSLHTRQMITGGNLHYGGVSPVCETITATGTTLKVSKTPAKHYAQPLSDEKAWCYVKPVGAANYMGTNYGVDLTTKQVDYTAVAGQNYEVFYFVQNSSAQVLELPDMFNPSVVTISQKYGVYAKQNSSVSHGTLQGYMYVVVPRAILNGSAGVSANQTDAATTDGSWMALSPDQNSLICEDCANSTKTFAYYIYVPCGGETAAVADLAVIGGGISVKVNETAQIPVVYVMPDGSTQTPTYTNLTYAIGSTSAAVENTPSKDTKAQVDVNGQVKGLATGATEVRITLVKGEQTLETFCNVTVTANT